MKYALKDFGNAGYKENHRVAILDTYIAPRQVYGFTTEVGTPITLISENSCAHD
jgi:hypothetical protein